MQDGLIKVGVATPDIRVADCEFNAKSILQRIAEAEKQKTKILVFPELCLTAYTCSDLFLSSTLLRAAERFLRQIADETKNIEMLILIGLPVLNKGKLYNCAAVLYKGVLLGLVPKSNLPNYGEFYESRQFQAASLADEIEYISFMGQERVPFGTKILFACQEREDLVLAIEICEDLWVLSPPSSTHARAGATIIANLSASDEIVGKDDYRRNLVRGQSARLFCAYLYADAGEGESTTDLVFAAHNMIAENGALLAEAKRFENNLLLTEIDLQRLSFERRRQTTFKAYDSTGYLRIPFSMSLEETTLSRPISARPFVPENKDLREQCCENILQIQSNGLKKRIAHTNAKSLVLGISGGLDSTLALLVMVRAIDMMRRDRKDILAITMPAFGTTARTRSNAELLCKKLGVTFECISITDAVLQHFKDIGQDKNLHDVTYENAQARERTQVLMDMANKTGGFVVGTGDLSELALGWATYNGDHMSMYAVNAGVPKTLVRYLVEYEAERSEDKALKQILLDVLDTPVSPELLPPKDGEIAQRTEELVGPYDLHDFFLYYVLRWGFGPKKVYRLACYAHKENFEKEYILAWLKTFYRRFFSQQFKRSCLPDGPKVGSVSLSPRGDWRMPSDATARLWLDELEEI